MPSGPTANQVRTVDAVLTGKLNSRIQSDEMFVADRAFPPLYQEGLESFTYPRVRTDFRSYGNINIRQAIGAPTEVVGFGVTWATGNTVDFGVKAPAHRALNARSQLPISLDLLAQSRAAAEVNVQRDVRLAAAIFVTGIWTTEATLATQWDDAAGVPLADFETAIRTVHLATGKLPDSCLLGYDAARVLRNNGDFTALVPSAERMSAVGEPTLVSLLKAHFGFKRVFVGKATRNTADEAQTETLAYAWTDNCLVWYGGADGQGDGQDLPAAGQIASTDGGAPTVVDRWYEDDPRTEWHRVRESRAEPVFDAAAGYLMIDCAN